ncbi:MAG: gliding motility-associated C-terminal domain-containing protein [Aquaticitalea sp.]
MKVAYQMLIGFMLCFPYNNYGQDVTLYQQFNGRYDYVAIGNTLNIIPNGAFPTCDILTSSTAPLNLNQNQTVVAAYLYWAGSGTGDLDIEVNGVLISAERVFSNTSFNGRIYFAAFADITILVQNEGNVNYTISELDLTEVISSYCSTGSNFGGWAIAIIYKDDALPLNQLNVYDGLQSVPNELSITLENLNVLDNEGAKIGFIAWEGDENIAVNETLSINGNPIGNPPLNPVNNVFNGTNSFTSATNLYNMDIDVYTIQNNISIGDTTATIKLTSGQDFVMINNIITVLNSQLPDATIVMEDYSQICGQQEIEVNYTVYNVNSTDTLPANTPISLYVNAQLIGQSTTQNDIPIGGSENGSSVLTLPNNLVDTFELKIIVDDDGTQNGIVTESNETNNQFQTSIDLLPIPTVTNLPEVIGCNEGFESASFNLIDSIPETIDSSTIIGFYIQLSDLVANENELFFPENYVSLSNPQTIYVKVEGTPCNSIYQFNISVENCPPLIPQGFSPTNDGINDWFNIQGLYNIFLRHELKIYNRYGVLIFEGNNATPWDGKANRGLNNLGILLPVGTYYYILNLNEPSYKPIIGWVYINY